MKRCRLKDGRGRRSEIHNNRDFWSFWFRCSFATSAGHHQQKAVECANAHSAWSNDLRHTIALVVGVEGHQNDTPHHEYAHRVDIVGGTGTGAHAQHDHDACEQQDVAHLASFALVAKLGANELERVEDKGRKQ